MNVEDIGSIFDRWSQTGEFRNVPPDKFVAIMLAAQKDKNTAGTALSLCYQRYDKNNPPPANLIKVLLETPIGGGLNPWPYWREIVLLYLGKHKISAEHGSVLLLKAAHASCLPDIFDKVLETNPVPEVWKAIVLAIMKAKKADRVVMRLELRKCKDSFNTEAVKCIHNHMKTRNPKILAPRIADVLPNNLSVMTQWMSLCEAQKTDVAIRLLDNIMTVAGSQPFGIEYYQSRLDDVRKARQGAPDLVRSWLDLYQASLQYKIGEMLWQRGNEIFKVGYTELVDNKKAFDDLEMWLEDPDNKIVGKDKLLYNIRTDREPWGRRKDGHVWHAILAKKLYESRQFKSVEVEQKVYGNGSPVDILLEDEFGKDIHIEAWDGITEMTHNIRRMFQTGERFDINELGQRGSENAIFAWRNANKWLNGKVRQLPPTGRNFVVAQYTPNELIWQSMDGVSLRNNTCAIQIEYQTAHVWCKDCKLMEGTALYISKALGCRSVVVNGSHPIQFDT